MLTAARARVYLFIAAALFSTGGAAIKLSNFTNWQVAATRSFVASIAFALAVPSARRRPTRKEILAGLAYAGSMITFVTANKLTYAANTIYLQSTAPLYLVIFGPLLLKERVRLSDLGFLALFALGTVLLFFGEPPAAHTAPHPLQGNIIATVSGVFWALTVCGLRATARGHDDSSNVVVLTGSVIACMLTAVPALVIEPERLLVVADYRPIIYLGIFQIALAYSFVTKAMKKLPALEASLLLMVEPVLAPLWAWAFNKETPDRWTFAGAGVILFATAALTIIDARRQADLPAGA